MVNVLDFEDLADAVLVGHSYGGVVVTGVADLECLQRTTALRRRHQPAVIRAAIAVVAAVADYGLEPQTGRPVVTRTTPAMEHFTTPAAADGNLFVATGNTVQAYTIAKPGSAPGQ